MRVKRAADRGRGARSVAAAREGGPAGAQAGGAGGRHDSRRGDGGLREIRHAKERKTAACWRRAVRVQGAIRRSGAGAGGCGVCESLRAGGI